MALNHAVLLTVLFGSLVYTYGATCSVLQDMYSKTCLGSRFTIRCIGVTIPRIMTYDECHLNVTDIMFRNSVVESIEDNSLPGLVFLEVFNSTIKNISDGAFNNCAHTLTGLRLSRSVIPDVPNVLRGLQHLGVLLLRDLTIGTWNSSDLHLVGQTVSHLNLGNNSLTTWPDWMQNFNALRILEFVDNPVTTIPDDSLQNVASTLTDLNVVGALTHIPSGWSELKALTGLTLRNNRLTQVRNIPPQITNLNLANNRITEITIDSFPLPSSLEILDLSRNPITTITKDAFTHLQTLSFLSLRYTSLTRMPLALTLLTHDSYIDMRNITGLVCTCLESGLTPWFSAHPALKVDGNCGEVGVQLFFTQVAVSCPSYTFHLNLVYFQAFSVKQKMALNHAVLFTVLFGSFVYTYGTTCSVLQDMYSKTCLGNGYTIRCNNVTIPRLMTYDECHLNVTEIMFRDSVIESIEDNSLPGLKYLEAFNSTIKNISDGAFNNCAQTLTSIHFSRSEVPDVPNVLSGLQHLGVLELRDVTIGTWNSSDLHLVGQTIWNLILANNSLTTWPEWMQNFKALKYLDFVDNHVTTVPDNALLNIANTLTDLNFEDANLIHIPNDWSQLKALKRLTLMDNILTEARNIPSQLSYLNLVNNRFTEITVDSFPLSSSLVELDLSENPITFISNDAFRNLQALSYLSLRYTSLTRVPLGLTFLTQPSHIDLRDVTSLVCTCLESGLTPWFSAHPTLLLEGICGDISIQSFYTELAFSCPG
ncbi:leucine-rich repeat protein soc-2 homolog [Physella acuta]|uniref:leucine-rich repeat protein soc-2 homolog n=1 Tax=Physella acuta TaxID=109671 RepID=UPI0027DBB003|nr:leucine-rich repeat protein soc-2 homolog [Physella acuta]